MRDPNAKTLVNKALVDEMRATTRGKRAAVSSGSTPNAVPNGEQESSPPSGP